MDNLKDWYEGKKDVHPETVEIVECTENTRDVERARSRSPRIPTVIGVPVLTNGTGPPGDPNEPGTVCEYSMDDDSDDDMPLVDPETGGTRIMVGQMQVNNYHNQVYAPTYVDNSTNGLSGENAVQIIGEYRKCAETMVVNA